MSPSPVSRKRWFTPKRLIFAVVGLLVLISFLGLGIWIYVRSDSFQRYLVGQIKLQLKECGLRGEIGGTELSWRQQTARIRDFKIYNDQTGQLIASIKRAELSAEILKPYAWRLTREILLKNLDLEGVDLHFEIDEQGRTNLEGLHNPPSTSGALSIDSSRLLASLTDGAIHIKDRMHRIEANLTDLKISAQPLSESPVIIGLRLDSAVGRLGFENRELKITKLGLTVRASESGAEIEQLDLTSSLVEAKAKGRIEEWKDLRYSLDFDSRINFDEVARVFLPEVAIKGAATSKGHIDGKVATCRLKGELNAGRLAVATAELSNVQIERINFDLKENQINFASGQVRVEEMKIDDVRVSAIAINNLKGDLKNGHVQANATDGFTTEIAWPDSKLSNLTITDLIADISSAGRGIRYELKTDASLKDGVISGVNFNNATTQATFDNVGLALTEVKGDIFGGNAFGEFTLPLDAGSNSVAKASFTDLYTKEIIALFAKTDQTRAGELPLAGRVAGEGEISFIGGNARSINGVINARFTGKANEASDAIPVTGEAAATAQNGVFNFNRLQLSTDLSQVTATGALSVDGESDLHLILTSTQAEQLLQIARSIDAAQPYIADYEPQLLGEFKFDGRILGRPDRTNFEGEIYAATAGLRDAILGELSGHLVISPVELRVEKGQVVSSNGGSMKIDLIAPLDPKANSGKLDATLDHINLEAILAAAGLPNANQFITGDMTGEAHLTGLPESLSGSAQFNLSNCKIADQPAQLAAIDFKFEGRNAILDRLEFQLPQSHLLASGQMSFDDYSFKLQGKSDRISLQGVAQAFELKEAQIEGIADADFTIAGKVITGKQPDLDWESLQVFLIAQGKNVKINGRETGQLKFGARTTSGGQIDFGLVTGLLSTTKSSPSSDQPEVLKGSIELRKSGRPIKIESELVDQNLAPLFEIFAPHLVSTVGGTISGRLSIQGSTVDDSGNATFDRLSGGLTLSKASLQLINTPIKIETPLVIALEAMQIKVGETRITGDGINLNFGGTFGLRGDAGMNFSLNGSIYLNQLPPITSDLLLNGLVKVETKLTGTADAPNLNGKLDINGFGFSSDGLPFFASQGTGHITFSGDQINLDNFKANINDGTIEANGMMKLARLQPSEWKYTIKAENAMVDYQNVNANLSGNFALTGTPQGQSLTGTISVPQAEYSPGFDLDNLFSSGKGSLSLSGFGASGGGQNFGIPPINLNVRVEARDSMIVRNDQINAVGSAALTISGTLSDPNLTGRIVTDGGSVRFRGQRYEISTGTLDLSPGSGSPQLNLMAESEISGYRITIGFIGPIDDIDLTLSSEPQLVRDEIIALITTGRTEAGTLTSQDPLRTGVGAAASLLSSGFISRPTEQLLGLSRFQIDPIIRPNANPAARLTVGQQISRNIYLSYSTNLATEQDQTALAEYTISNRFSALATYTQGGNLARQGVSDGAFTIELRGRKRFSLGFEPGVKPTAAGSGDQKNAINSVIRPKLPSVDVEVSKVPNFKLSNRKLHELLPVMTQGFSRSLARLGEKRLKEYLQEQGYFFSEVHYRCQPENCGGDNLQVFYEIEPGAIYDLKEIRIEGTQLLKLRDVQSNLQSQLASEVGGVPFLKDLPIIGGYVRGLTSNDRLKNDEETIRLYLLDIGFRNARVKSRLAVKPDNDDLIVVFEVEEGLQSEIARVNVRGNNILSLRELREAVPIQSGEAFSFSRAQSGIQQIKQLYAQRGFLEANVDLEFANVDEERVLLTYQIDEGSRAFVSEITINGLSKTGPNWVRRFLDFKQGDLLTPAKIRQTQRDLYATNAFREVTVRAETTGGDDGSAHRVILDLTEAKPMLLTYGLGYSTDDGMRGLFEIANNNLGGSLNSLALRLRGSRGDQFAQLSFTDLRPFDRKLPTTVSVFYNRNTNLQPFVRRRIIDKNNELADSDEGQGFGFQRFAAFIQTERKLGERTSSRFRYNLERANLFGIDQSVFPDTEVTRNERAIRLGMFSLGLTHDTRDNALNPTKGSLISADHSLASRLLGGNESFNKFFSTYQNYKTLAPDLPLLGNSTLAFSARLGLAAMFRFSDRNNDGIIDESERRLPISERFFSGGATTLRGFRFETAGPQDILEPRTIPVNRACNTGIRPCDLPTLVPIGGDALAIFNFELRYPLTQRLRLVPFYDLGNVFRRVSDINFSNMTNTVGLGLRINTPLGPIGVDYGFLIDPPFYVTSSGSILRQRSGAFHVRLGQSF